METQNQARAITHAVTGTGYTLEARQYTYVGAPAFEIYGVVGNQPTIDPIGYYEDGPRGVEHFVIEDRLATFVRSVYDTVFAGHYDIAGNPDPVSLSAIEAELCVLIEEDLLYECMEDIPPARLYKSAQFEIAPWYFYLNQGGKVVVEYLPTSVAAHDAYFVVADQDGRIADIVEGARTWVQTDPFWGLHFVQAEKQTALTRLQASLRNAIAAAVTDFNTKQIAGSHA